MRIIHASALKQNNTICQILKSKVLTKRSIQNIFYLQSAKEWKKYVEILYSSVSANSDL